MQAGRRRAWARLVLGLIFGPVAAEALTEPLILKIRPALAMPAPALALGWMVANDPRDLMRRVARMIEAELKKGSTT